MQRRLLWLTVCALVVATVSAVPAASAGHWECDRTEAAHAETVLGPVNLRVFQDPCTGVEVNVGPGGCLDVLWGVHTEDAGVGGDDTCQTHAWVKSTPEPQAPDCWAEQTHDVPPSIISVGCAYRGTTCAVTTGFDGSYTNPRWPDVHCGLL